MTSFVLRHACVAGYAFRRHKSERCLTYSTRDVWKGFTFQKRTSVDKKQCDVPPQSMCFYDKGGRGDVQVFV